jgi:hypothetical protein
MNQDVFRKSLGE